MTITRKIYYSEENFNNKEYDFTNLRRELNMKESSKVEAIKFAAFLIKLGYKARDLSYVE